MQKIIAVPLVLWCLAVNAQEATITIHADKPGNRVSPTLHGVFFEEISHAGEGGLYAELIQNRGFEESRLPPGTVLDSGFIIPPRTPHFSMPGGGVSDWKMEWPLTSKWPAWSIRSNGGLTVTPSLTDEKPLTPATPHSMQLEITQRERSGGTVELANEGFWGIPVTTGEIYHCSFYLHTDRRYRGSCHVYLQAADGRILADANFSTVNSATWKKFHCDLSAKGISKAARLVLAFDRPGTVWVDFVSLFPARTFDNRPNGLRRDLAQYIADLKPAFIRWPGGCFVEGIDIQSAPDWKRTIGPVETRPGTYSPWGYWSSDGFGYHEYLQFCEDIGAAALYVFNAGVSCDFRSGTFIPDDSLEPYIENALDAIEYAIGDTTTRWGRVRAANGHPAPFPLKYVEVGNEQSGPRYARRYNRFYDAIKSRYPGIRVIAAMGIGDINKYTLDSMRSVDIADEHAYKSARWAMSHYLHFDGYKRGKWDVYVGEYATNNGVGSGNMEAALSDAVYILGMERNGDLVKMSSYAPLLVNVNDIDWPVNLINFNADSSFARISYYAIKMLSKNRADVNLHSEVTVRPAVKKKERFAGGIGLATWDTQTEYKDIEVIQDGKTVYHSDFAPGAQAGSQGTPGIAATGISGWTPVRGAWKIQDSALAQTAMGAQRLMVLNQSFGSYTLKLKARKLGGYNAFLVAFAVGDSNTCMRAHIGSWLNSHCVMERLTNGYDVADLTEQQRLPSPIETGRWYDIRLEVGPDTVKCFLDDTLLMTYHEPPCFFSLAGRDETTGDIIVKMVNAAADPYHVQLHIDGAGALKPQGELTVLAGEGPDAENSFQYPQKYVPIKSAIQGIGPDFETAVRPYSISVLRIQTKFNYKRLK